jgi:hypothetical protein
MAQMIFRDRIFSMAAFATGFNGESNCTIRAKKGLLSCRWKYDVQIDFVTEKAPGKIAAISEARGTVSSSETALGESIRVQGRYGEIKQFMETHDKAAGWSGLFNDVAKEIFKNDSSLSGPKYPTQLIHRP